MKLISILFIATSHSLMGGTGEPTGLWAEELADPYYQFQEQKYEIEVASIDGGEIPLDPRSINDDAPESTKRFLDDAKAMAKLNNSVALKDVDLSKYDAIFLPGGHGTVWDFPKNAKLAEIVGKAMDENKVVASVCHGPVGLLSTKLANGDSILKGKNVTGFSNTEEEAVELTNVVPLLLEDEMVKLGANYTKADNFKPYAVKDGNLITGQNPASSAKVAELVIETLNK
tara:strand:- start:4053 stop:4739 length:687 start_codon:yes stop_codon:yes gene_type:complete